MMEGSKNSTLVMGASENPGRYSNMAVKRLIEHGHPVKAIGVRKGRIGEVEIITEHPDWKDIETITLYIRPELQPPLYDYFFSLNPNRIIFNPGTENDELEALAKAKGIRTEEACTLVLLSTGAY